MMNLGHYDPGETAVVYGSGDIGLIVARELILHGKNVKRIVEIQPQSPAMERNRRQCLEKYQIPLQVNTKVAELHGTDRLEGVTVQNIQSGVREYIPCDMLVVAAGLIPDRTLLQSDEFESGRQQSLSWLYLCGNCERIHPIADSVSMQAEQKVLEILRDYEK